MEWKDSISVCLWILLLQFNMLMRVEAFGAPETSLLSLVPSQLLAQQPSRYRRTSPTSIQQSSSVAADAESTSPADMPKASDISRRKKKRRSKKKKRPLHNSQEQPPIDATMAADVNTTSQVTNAPTNPPSVSVAQLTRIELSVASYEDPINRIYPKSGDLPDVHWRSIPMEHLRKHPKFQPLPPPQDIIRLDCLEDAKMFRQESWQWDALHNGRCTTSQAVAALGFLEPSTGQVLGVPTYWQKGGMGAFYRLRQKPIRTLEEMNKVLCAHDDSDTDSASGSKQPLLWRRRAEGNVAESNHTFAYSYLYQTPESEIKRRKASIRRLLQNQVAIKTIRMSWGNAQEATALLAALNYFSERDSGFVMKESGMCGAGLGLNETAASSLLIGATPDAILCHSDGSIEALEVKNHCPFSVPWVTKGKRRSNHRFRVGDFPFDDNLKVFSHYIPQLMMEMLCLGPECRSVVLVRQTATNGALLLRLHRDDEWIDDMVHFLERFQTEFVAKDTPPPQDFFWQDNDATSTEEVARYRRFVNKTLEIRNKIEIIDHIPHEKIQRVASSAPIFLD